MWKAAYLKLYDGSDYRGLLRIILPLMLPQSYSTSVTAARKLWEVM